MRTPHAVFITTVLTFPLATFAFQAPASGPSTPPAAPTSSAPPAAPAPAPPVPSALLKPALANVEQAVAAIKLDKWKRGSVRDAAGTNIKAIQRDLEEKLPSLVTTADATPGSLSRVLPLSRNIDALYDVLVHVIEQARVSAPGDEIPGLEQAMDSLEKARVTLGNGIQDTAAAQEKQLIDLRTTVQTQAASLRAAAVPAAKPVCPAPPAPVRKKKSTASSTSTPKTTKPTTTTPPTATPAKPQ